MKSTIFALAAAAGSAYAATEAAAYGQCGGENWTGATACGSGWTCQVQNPYYSQCVAGSGSASASSVATVATSAASTVNVTSTIAPKTSTLVTKASNSTSSKAASTSAASASAVSLAVSTTSTTATTRASTSSTSTSAAASSTSTGKVKYAGTNISGFDFGCSTDGTCTISEVDDPSTTGKEQMEHFVTDTGLNAFRLPVAWQYLTNDVVGATLDTTNLAAYDVLVQNCISAGAELCIIDIHNYARWNGEIIGQGGPTNAQFSSLWSQLATKYASQTKVAFGIMNEPHDLDDVTTWAATVQAAVTAIRQAGATDNLVLLPGNDWTHASTYISDGSAAALLTVTNIDGSTDNLIFDVHQYLDSDGSGTASTCTTDNVSTFTTLAAWLRTNSRMAMLTETGGGPTDSTCLTNVCAELAYLASNSDVFLGWTGWGAGMFATSYVLSEVPTGTYPSFVDQTLVTQCIAGEFK